MLTNLTPVIIRTRMDALIWTAVDQRSDGHDIRPLIRELEHELYRAQSAEILYHDRRIDQLVQLLRATDPDQLTGRPKLALAR